MARQSGRLDPLPHALRTALGPLALEGVLLADLSGEIAGVRADPRRLALPLSIVVPSHCLRTHLAARAVAALRGPLVGVAIDTLYGLALAVLERAGEPEPRGASLFSAYARRHARREPALERDLGHLDDGTRAVVATLDDLFDAGFDAAHEEALLEALVSEGRSERSAPGARELERARALVRVAGATARDFESLGLRRRTAIYERAACLVARDPALVRARAVWIHGYADATAAALDLIATLQQRVAARIYFDETPAHAPRTRPEQRYGARFQERLGIDLPSHPIAAATAVSVFRAPGRQAEVREVAVRIAGLLAAGVEPERIGVVARDLDPLRIALRLHLRRLAIPFSGRSASGAPGPAERRARALADLLRARADLSVERWLDARAAADDQRAHARHDGPRITLRRARDHDLLLALRALGAVRLRDVRAIDLAALLGGRDSYALPVRRGGERPGSDHDGERAASDADESSEADAFEEASARGGDTRHRRRVARSTLETARREVAHLCDFLAASPEPATAAAHAARVRRVVREHLLWTESSPGDAPVEAVLAAIESDVPETAPLTTAEFTAIFAQSIGERCRTRLGGLGAGVACLTVAEARARTFEHLFLLGLNHGVFPRYVREDPLLQDPLRRRLATVLPDLSARALGYDEDRFLFEQLLRSAPTVTLSWRTVDDDGKAQAPSPFVERCFPGAPEQAELAPAVLPRERSAIAAGASARPAHENAILAALHGTRAEFARLLPAAVRAGLAGAGAPHGAADEIAAARVRILDEIDPPPSRHAELGPYYGFVGRLERADDPRAQDLFVTTLEKMADCPWRAFLTRLLRIEPVPDPLDTLPSVDARMVGNLVHAVLQRIACDALGLAPEALPRNLDELRAQKPCAVVWPAPAELEALAQRTAREILRDEGIVLLGLGRVLVLQARPALEVARRIDAEEALAGSRLLGAEVFGAYGTRAAADGSQRTLRFVADRVDAIDGGLRLTDYKTGAPIADKKRSATRDKHFLARVEEGRSLQAVVYALAAGPHAQGRYLFLEADLAEEARRFRVASDERPWFEAYARATSTLFRGWRDGSFVPRLVDASLAREHRACRHCEVSQACLRGDSGARTRLVDWVRARDAHDERSDTGPEAAAYALLRIGRRADADAGASDAALALPGAQGTPA